MNKITWYQYLIVALDAVFLWHVDWFLSQPNSLINAIGVILLLNLIILTIIFFKNGKKTSN